MAHIWGILHQLYPVYGTISPFVYFQTPGALSFYLPQTSTNGTLLSIWPIIWSIKLLNMVVLSFSLVWYEISLLWSFPAVGKTFACSFFLGLSERIDSISGKSAEILCGLESSGRGGIGAMIKDSLRRSRSMKDHLVSRWYKWSVFFVSTGLSLIFLPGF